MGAKEYREKFRSHCELERYFPGGNERELAINYPRPSGHPHQAHVVRVGGRRNLTGTELHHICGSGNGADRVDVDTNMIMVSSPVHNWLETYKLPGFVLCCWAKLAKCELDWETMAAIKGKELPSWLETDPFIQQCKQFPWLEQLRQNLVSARPRSRKTAIGV
jgi:hypothetical protein